MLVSQLALLAPLFIAAKAISVPDSALEQELFKHERAIGRANEANRSHDLARRAAYAGPFKYEFDTVDDDSHVLVPFGNEDEDDFPQVEDGQLVQSELPGVEKRQEKLKGGRGSLPPRKRQRTDDDLTPLPLTARERLMDRLKSFFTKRASLTPAQKAAAARKAAAAKKAAALRSKKIAASKSSARAAASRKSASIAKGKTTKPPVKKTTGKTTTKKGGKTTTTKKGGKTTTTTKKGGKSTSRKTTTTSSKRKTTTTKRKTTTTTTRKRTTTTTKKGTTPTAAVCKPQNCKGLPPNSKGKCLANGKCSFDCLTGYVRQGNVCAMGCAGSTLHCPLPALHAHRTCKSNVCGTACNTGYTLVGGVCTKASTVCAKNCPAIANGSVTCNAINGMCTYACDGSGYKLTVKNGKASCVKTAQGNTANNCGSTARVCPESYNGLGFPVCNAGVCSLTCPSGHSVVSQGGISYCSSVAV